LYENSNSNAQKGLGINFATFTLFSNENFKNSWDDIERSAPIIPYSSTTNKGGVKGYAIRRHFCAQGFNLGNSNASYAP
jgi:hypothetical protein